MKVLPGTDANGDPCLSFVGLPADKKAKFVALAGTLNAALADGKLSLAEDLMIGFALGALFQK